MQVTRHQTKQEQSERTSSEIVSTFLQLNKAFIEYSFTPLYYTLANRKKGKGVYPRFGVFALNPNTNTPDLFSVPFVKTGWFSNPVPTLRIDQSAYYTNNFELPYQEYYTKQFELVDHWNRVLDTAIKEFSKNSKYKTKYPCIGIPTIARPNFNNTNGWDHLLYLHPEDYNTLNTWEYADPQYRYLQARHKDGDVLKSYPEILGVYLAPDVEAQFINYPDWYQLAFNSAQAEIQFLATGELKTYLEQQNNERIINSNRQDPYNFEI